MQLHQHSISETISKRYFQEIDHINQYSGVEDFYSIESKLLFEIFHLESTKAKKSLHELIDILSIRFGKQVIKVVRNYFVILSSIVARKLLDNQVPSKKAFAFNLACADMIENKMKDAEFLQFADELIDFYVYFIADRKQPTFRHQTVNKVIMYINDELESDLTVESIANKFHISTSHLSRIFREHVGITLVEYLNVRRVEESQYYLRHTNKSITSISDQFHFCNQSYFTRIFKKYTGVTPKHFRDELHHEFFRYEMNEVEFERV
ncbi:YesN/AraC family two-component response regulator [Lysinibacillus composti]|uniref:AraC family transcriptional regulator n=1 Tax=Lysinibacillus composti TaxID=720633 RepID=A0A3N9U4P0_9BACI|nr:helix-turn-helix transcriptional regulator [Lysinibacillus composti]MBM7610533.1 YesN/AraC family two-component response regulator [Lysinibacillus composti]RQW71589.1 AraC family transcriptional regulator [Lysinibacillus composti]